MWALIALALLSTAAGYIVYFALLARAGATNVLLVTLLIPPSALLLGAFFLGESWSRVISPGWHAPRAGWWRSTGAHSAGCGAGYTLSLPSPTDATARGCSGL